MAVDDHSRVQSQNQNQSQNGSSQETHEVTVVIVPLPAQGHLNQLLHLSLLISSYNIPVHYVGAAAHVRQARLRVQGWDPLAISNIHFHEFSIPYEAPPPTPNAHAPAKFPVQLAPSINASTKLREPIYALLQQLSGTTRRLAVIHDFVMTYVVQDVGLIPNAESYSFSNVSAFTMYTYDWEEEGKPRVFEPEILEALEAVPSHQSSIPPELTDFVKLQGDTKLINSGYLYNACRAIEGPYLDLLAKGRNVDSDKQWAVGPLNPVEINEQKNSNKRHYCLEWLDKQASDSVIFVSFGSTITLSDEEAKEIAIGLEQSGQKFIWVLRDADKGDIFKEEARRSTQLPGGFEERVEGGGIVERDWAPQLEILGHASTGGFMSHCGWNSCMESISTGVPVAAWPVHSDQPRNAILLEKVLKIGLSVRGSQRDGLVTSTTVENAVRRLMDSAEGEEIRQRAKELSKAVKGSVMEGGVSRLEMDSFIAHIRR